MYGNLLRSLLLIGVSHMCKTSLLEKHINAVNDNNRAETYCNFQLWPLGGTVNHILTHWNMAGIVPAHSWLQGVFSAKRSTFFFLQRQILIFILLSNWNVSLNLQPGPMHSKPKNSSRLGPRVWPYRRGLGVCLLSTLKCKRSDQNSWICEKVQLIWLPWHQASVWGLSRSSVLERIHSPSRVSYGSLLQVQCAWQAVGMKWTCGSTVNVCLAVCSPQVAAHHQATIWSWQCSSLRCPRIEN